MTAAAQDAGWHFIEIADRLKQQDTQHAQSGAFNHGGIRREKSGEKITEEYDQADWNGTADRGQKQRLPQDLPASGNLSGGKVLSSECRRCLSKCRDDVVSKVFIVHSDRASRDCGLPEPVYRRLHKDIRETEYCSLYRGGNRE